MQRPKPGETEEDILKLQEEFKRKPPSQRAAQVVNAGQQDSNQSLFAQNRRIQQAPALGNAPLDQFRDMRSALGNICERPFGDSEMNEGAASAHGVQGVVVGNVVENVHHAPKEATAHGAASAAFPQVDRVPIQISPRPGSSLFALTMEARNLSRPFDLPMDEGWVAQPFNLPQAGCSAGPQPAMGGDDQMQGAVGGASNIVQDQQLAEAVHNENMQYLAGLNEEQINIQRSKIMQMLNPEIVEYIASRRQAAAGVAARPAVPQNQREHGLPPGNAAFALLSQGQEENWLNFDTLETDKLKWLSDIPAGPTAPADKYEARFNWRGMLMPYTLDENAHIGRAVDSRDLFLHGDEAHRPGYTLQELFRFARSNVHQQRLSAFLTIAGLLDYYNQGLYDNVIELPVSKLYFLTRIGCDESSAPLLEASFHAMTKLLYNEMDEQLLDLIYENPDAHVQPSFEKCQDSSQPVVLSALLKSDVNTDDLDLKDHGNDFELAETDLIECVLRTQLIGRIRYVLSQTSYDNAVPSCLKILIRVARKSEAATDTLATDNALMSLLFERFLKPFDFTDLDRPDGAHHKVPQSMCLKLMRIMMAQSDRATKIIMGRKIIETLRGLFFTTQNLHSNSIMVQVEALRVFHTLALKKVRIDVHGYLPVMEYLLMQHFHHLNYQGGGSNLLRQHAAALLNAITAITMPPHQLGPEIGHTLRICCSKWLTQATNSEEQSLLQEFSQSTLLAAVMNAIRHHGRTLFQTDSRTFASQLNEFVASDGFLNLIRDTGTNSVLLRHNLPDRHMAHKPLPNAGSVLVGPQGPELIVPRTYPFHLLWTIIRTLDEFGGDWGVTVTAKLLYMFGQPNLYHYLERFVVMNNDELCRNFFAKTEIRLLFYMAKHTYVKDMMTPELMLKLSYKLVNVGTADFVGDIRDIITRVLFNTVYMDMNPHYLTTWSETYLAVLPEFEELQTNTLTLPSHGRTLLPGDWPYIFILKIYQCFLDNNPSPVVDAEVIKMTLFFTLGLDIVCPELIKVTPEQKLMYFMMAFMSDNTDFLSPDVHVVLAKALHTFYRQHANYHFQFDKARVGKFRFENMYYLFVNHYQGVSYGDPLFGSLVMVPLAQRYPSKWRLRVWSESINVFSTLDCEEYLLGGLQAYLEPIETDVQLLAIYHTAFFSGHLTPMIFRIVQKHLINHCRNNGIMFYTDAAPRRVD